MNFEINTSGYNHEFHMDMNELIIECYDYQDYCVGSIGIVINKEESEKLINILKGLK